MSASAVSACGFVAVALAKRFPCAGAPVHCRALVVSFRCEYSAWFVACAVAEVCRLFRACVRARRGARAAFPVLPCAGPVVPEGLALLLRLEVLWPFALRYAGCAAVPRGEVVVPVGVRFAPVTVVAVEFSSVVSAFMEVAPVEAVSQSVPFVRVAVVERAAFVPTASAVVVPAVASAVGYVYPRPPEVEVVAARIARVYCEVP